MLQLRAIATAPIPDAVAAPFDVDGDDVAGLRVDTRSNDADQPTIGDDGLHAMPDNPDD
ncbi:MAG TPA: hypothetical protein VE974_23225 [Thermoanaerobaculia bacterium]|nr:hypothetical protein [Thermoanaerobaculia bacterium]